MRISAVGVSAPIREALRTVLPLIEVSVERDQRISFVTITPIKKVEVTFTLNEEYEERLLDGTILRVTIPSKHPIVLLRFPEVLTVVCCISAGQGGEKRRKTGFHKQLV